MTVSGESGDRLPTRYAQTSAHGAAFGEGEREARSGQRIADMTRRGTGQLIFEIDITDRLSHATQTLHAVCVVRSKLGFRFSGF